MGLTNSKAERSNALNLCKGRKRFIKQAIDSRYALAAAHVSYVQSLRNVGIALRRYAEAEVYIETSISASATEVDKTPSHSSCTSPLPSRAAGGVPALPVPHSSPLPLSTATISCMRSSGASALTIRVSPPPRNVFVEEDEFSMPPPPPPPPEAGSSWDYFNPGDESFRYVGQNGLNLSIDDVRMYRNFGKEDVDLNGTSGIHEGSSIPKLEAPSELVVSSANLARPENTENTGQQRVEVDARIKASEKEVKGSMGYITGKASPKQSNLRKNTSFVEKDICAEREDASEFITHRAKDFVSSIKDIDNRFFRASESGKEVSRMLESSKIPVGCAEARGTPSASIYLVCCQGGTANVSDDQHVTKVIAWKRTTSTKSSLSRNHFATTKDENDDSGNDFIEEFCMISGSHSSTLDRMYAWERKLYDEVKASESIQKEYDRKCDHLRHQFAKDLSPQVIDKTRAVIKDLHSRIRVALHAVDSISKRIEKMRDEELLPQLLELIQGLTKMWKSMLECHQSQYITISLAYYAKDYILVPRGETHRQIINQLQDKLECFGLSFANWINSYTSFVEALNSWLQNYIILTPRERHKGRRAFSPRRYAAPPIFVLCRDWSAGIKSLPSQEVSDAIRAFLSDLQHSVRPQMEELLRKDLQNDDAENKEAKNEDRSSNISCIQGSLTKVLDRLSKFSEASVKMCEDIQQKCETARKVYDNYKAPPKSFSI